MRVPRETYRRNDTDGTLSLLVAAAYPVSFSLTFHNDIKMEATSTCRDGFGTLHVPTGLEAILRD